MMWSGVAWRVISVLAFASTASMAVTFSRDSLSSPYSGPSAFSRGAGAGAQHGGDVAARRGGIGPCAASGLRIRVRGAAARYVIEFTNVSDAPCSLRGYPSVSAYAVSARDGMARLLGVPAGRDMAGVAPLVVLGRGESADSAVSVTAPSGRGCQPVPATGLRVTPPGERAGRLVRRPMTACSARGVGTPAFLRVRAVRRG